VEDAAVRKKLIAPATLLAWREFEVTFIQSIFREAFMRESVIYQSILREGFEIGFPQGFQQGLLEAQAELPRLLRRLLTHRLGGLEPEFEERIARLSIPQLRDLAEDLLDFSSVADLVSWLKARES
jgi:predicted transposase YdaD